MIAFSLFVGFVEEVLSTRPYDPRRPGDHDIHAQYPARVAAAIARLSDATA